MSQPNNYPPTFNFESFYPPQSSQLGNGASFPQWVGQRPRPTGVASAKPSQTYRPVRTAPISRPASLMNFNPSHMHQQDSRIDPNLSLLQVPELSRPRSALDSLSNANPITRFYEGDDAPWSSERMRNTGSSGGRLSHSQPNMAFGSYREDLRSENESLAPRSDSGYYTHQTHSIISHDQERCDQELPSEMFQVGNITVGSASSETTEMYPAPNTDQISQYSGRSTGNGKEFKCPQCQEISKCKSDHKKHMLKHDKPFKCDIPRCRRGNKGFTTVNDLNRHKKSVHGIGALQNSYRCASETCRNKEKIWPRLDNFKQHIHRMHSEEDETDLIRRSVFHTQQSTPAAETPSVAPMDTTLAGIAPERQFSSNGFDDPISGMTLTPDQAPTSWSSFEPSSSQDFAIDVDQSNPNIYDQGPQKTNMPINPGYKPAAQARTAVYDMNAISLPPGTMRRNSSLRLDALATVASSQSSPEKPVPQPTPQLSKEPQTKAEQQKQALQKFSKIIVRDIQSSSSSEPVDLEEVVLRVLSRLGKKDATSSSLPSSSQNATSGSSSSQNVSMDTDPNTLTKTEALKASQAISKIIKQSGKRPIGISSRPRTSSSNMKACEHCDVTLARSCDMRKHMKRHTKPYGCTYPRCHKRFGAKSDWKRHENSQHFQLESYWCQLLSLASQTPCGELFYRADLFKNHLQKEHKKTDEGEIELETKNRRIGRNGQGQFFCGFCVKIVKLTQKRNAAWDERFNHIDEHFKAGKRIEEWHCIEAKKTKGKVLKEMNKMVFEEEDTEPEISLTNESSDEGQMILNQEPSQCQSQPQTQHSPIASSPPSSGQKKRPAEADTHEKAPPQKRERRQGRQELMWYCCQCKQGPRTYRNHVVCIECDHQACKSCEWFPNRENLAN
ncbi:uncharacterized protein BDR25DRAFT_116972 [Lindgomyces ingoldianus]|uniref:Uncharacterized protein n=1 Tax=Lindgomyces ingoldianus TaxID=673940 RepID=A0ACB6QA50_9PLEO|nr:uncharacterized protein BDR25DRAFT_116972 [Lindgomyces ingoldianus]KAF2462997.1 hypothetical protein BDR25DRAFT_116972 [Lindgomyces ingoldianus]